MDPVASQMVAREMSGRLDKYMHVCGEPRGHREVIQHSVDVWSSIGPLR